MGMKDALPFVGMVIVEFAQVGLFIVAKEALSSGMTNYAFVFYSNVIASLILLPSSFFIHRSNRPPLTFSIVSAFFLLGLLGCLTQVIGTAGIQYVPASFASAMLNLMPGFTFILAVIFRMEKLEGRSSSTIAKSIGTIVSITGAFIVTLYKGPHILMTPSHSNSPDQPLLMQQYNFVIGGLLLGFNSVLSSAFVIIQALILKKFQAEMIVVFFYCFFVAILSPLVSLIVERDLSAWSLQPKTRLIAILCSGFFGSGFQIGIGMWCLPRKGPLFVAMFHPLGIVIAAAMGIVFLGDTFYLGSLAGSIVIVIGFYSVMWGKANEGKIVKDNEASWCRFRWNRVGVPRTAIVPKRDPNNIPEGRLRDQAIVKRSGMTTSGFFLPLIKDFGKVNWLGRNELLEKVIDWKVRLSNEK
ncbi:WAT1-related protein At4g15540-like [Cornus florida]|uniref:WAT1-related protein At4g15540-like n=1 Tax=Cornus florida TaxID=4283 RepID=UPI00289EE8F5|nr:WAT1-related protein At4g15540-like [Cornus florida]